MSTDDDKTELKEVLATLRNSPLVNGELQKCVSHIQGENKKILTELRSIKETQQKHSEKFDDINRALHDPSNGIYSRIQKSESLDKQQNTDIDKLKEKQEKLNYTKHEVKNMSEQLTDIGGGKTYPELRRYVQANKSIRRILWLGIGVIITGLVSMGLPLVF